MHGLGAALGRRRCSRCLGAVSRRAVGSACPIGPGAAAPMSPRAMPPGRCPVKFLQLLPDPLRGAVHPPARAGTGAPLRPRQPARTYVGKTLRTSGLPASMGWSAPRTTTGWADHLAHLKARTGLPPCLATRHELEMEVFSVHRRPQHSTSPQPAGPPQPLRLRTSGSRWHRTRPPRDGGHFRGSPGRDITGSSRPVSISGKATQNGGRRTPDG